MVEKIPPDRDDGDPSDDADVARELQTEEPNSTLQGNASASAAATTGANTVNYIESAQTQSVIPKTPIKPNPPAASANTPGVTVPPSPNGRKYRALYEDMQARYLELQKEYESAISEKDATVNQLTETSSGNIEIRLSCVGLTESNLIISESLWLKLSTISYPPR